MHIGIGIGITYPSQGAINVPPANLRIWDATASSYRLWDSNAADFRSYGSAAGIWTPEQSLGLVAFYQWHLGNCWTDIPPLSAAFLTDPVQVETSRFCPGAYAKQTTAGARPTFEADGLHFNTTSGYLQFANAVSLPGDFTAYVTGVVTAANVNWCPLASTGSSCILRYLDGNLYFIRDDTAQLSIAAGFSGNTLLRVRRSGGAVRAAWTGQAEIAVGTSSGVVTFNTIAARPGVSQFNGNANNSHRMQAIINRNITPGSAEDLNWLAWILANDGATL